MKPGPITLAAVAQGVASRIGKNNLMVERVSGGTSGYGATRLWINGVEIHSITRMSMTQHVDTPIEIELTFYADSIEQRVK